MYWRNVGGEEHAYTKIWGNTVHCSTAQNLTLLTGIPVPSYGEVWARRNVVGLSRPCRHRRVGIATRGRESERCIGGMLAARNMLIRKFGGTQYTAVLLRISRCFTPLYAALRVYA